MTADTFGSNYDTVLSAYTGSPGSFTQQFCNDDTGGLQSQISFSVTGGTTYHFMVSAFASDGGDLVFHLTASGTLTVTKTGSGSGTVTSADGGINCGATCSATYPSGTAVTLTATAAAGSVFAGWSGGGCSGTGACTVTVTGNTTVTATFTLQTFTLTHSAPKIAARVPAAAMPEST